MNAENRMESIKSMQSIAIDGPAGAGKSTLSRRLARELKFLYVDTGAIYRTVALFALRRGVDCGVETEVAGLLPELNIRLEPRYRVQRMFLNDEDVTKAIRAPEVSTAASQVSAHPAVRDFLLEMQRELARTHNVVMDGRDIGTVVLPDATVKIFLTASVEERAKRRYHDLQKRGEKTDFETVLADIRARDQRDMTRAVAPLREAEDAIHLDTSALSFAESLQLLLKTVQEHLA